MVDELTDIMSALLWNLNEAQISHDRSDRVKELLQNNDYRNASFLFIPIDSVQKIHKG